MTRSTPVLVTVTAVFALSLSLVGFSRVTTAAGSAQEVAGAPQNPIAMSEESINAGRQMYGRFCRSCHGTAATGNGVAAPPESTPADLIDDEWDHGSTDGEIFLLSSVGEAVKSVIVALPFVGTLFEIGGMWLTRFVSAEFALLVVAGGTLFAAGYVVIASISMFELWIKKEASQHAA